MKIDKKEVSGILIAIGMMIGIGIVTILLGKSLTGDKKEYVKHTAGNLTEGNIAKDQVTVWYYDESFTDYFKECEKVYREKYGVSLQYINVREEDYLESINECSIDKEDAPDVYIMDSTMLEKAALAGLTRENRNDATFNDKAFSKTAITAATYKGHLEAYPMNFDTGFILYNTAYVANAPATFDDIINFSNTMDESVSGKIENVLFWDVKDLMYNYGFAGGYIEYGGKNGDDATVKNISGDSLKAALGYYANLNQIFAVDIGTSYENVLKKFAAGKAAFIIAKTDSIKALEEDDCVSYGVGAFPDLNADLKSKSLAVTNLAVVNPYGNNSSEADRLAKFISYDMAELMYETTGKLSARVDLEYDNEQLYNILGQYEKSTNLPKVLEAGDFGAKLEVALNMIWQGGDIDTAVAALQ